jgi:hypothetical protein
MSNFYKKNKREEALADNRRKSFVTVLRLRPWMTRRDIEYIFYFARMTVAYRMVRAQI